MSQRELNLESSCIKGSLGGGHLWSLEDGYSPFLKSGTFNIYFASIRYLDIEEPQNSILRYYAWSAGEKVIWRGRLWKETLRMCCMSHRGCPFRHWLPPVEYQVALLYAGDGWAKTGLTLRDFPAWGEMAKEINSEALSLSPHFDRGAHGWSWLHGVSSLPIFFFFFFYLEMLEVLLTSFTWSGILKILK